LGSLRLRCWESASVNDAIKTLLPNLPMVAYSNTYR
jgi:hypothetical protein